MGDPLPDLPPDELAEVWRAVRAALDAQEMPATGSVASLEKARRM
jgi:hypothetical protein